ncbi:hypothetical protein SAMN04489842_3992 [Natronobacterium texcoconense]|uniref:Uncharacterized protein n=1 Tax=Natronobacterium texcoconense TaxID=1095778 RepID=A0A1H1J181_NATTX|nr:hypothetical protein SAMN04489842_3992 [Natronobacterium texcoconense]
MDTVAELVLVVSSLLIIGVPAWYIWRWNLEQSGGKDDT